MGKILFKTRYGLAISGYKSVLGIAYLLVIFLFLVDESSLIKGNFYQFTSGNIILLILRWYLGIAILFFTVFLLPRTISKASAIIKAGSILKEKKLGSKLFDYEETEILVTTEDDKYFKTNTHEWLSKYIAKNKSGIIGIVGLRGTGKTTLQNNVMKEQLEEGYVAFCISCPTKIEEVDFVINLFERLCSSVMRKLKIIFKEFIPDIDEDLPKKVGKTRRERVLRILGFPSLFLGTLGLIFFFISKNNPFTYLTSIQYLTLVVSLTAMGIIFIFYGYLGKILRGSMDERILHKRSRIGADHIELFLKTKDVIEVLAYEQSIKSKVESDIGLAKWLSIKLGREKTLKRRPFTLAGLIYNYRDYIENFVIPVFKKVIIVIDELDKVVDPNEVRDFLRKIKATFGIENVYYILSVATDVLESFQLRSILHKGEADSTFTEVVNINPFSLEDSVKMLNVYDYKFTERENSAIGVVAAGIPRDVVRIAKRYDIYRTLNKNSKNFTSFLYHDVRTSLDDFLRYFRGNYLYPEDLKAQVGESLFNLENVNDDSTLNNVIKSFNNILRGKDSKTEDSHDKGSSNDKDYVNVVKPDDLIRVFLLRLKVYRHLISQGQVENLDIIKLEKLRTILERLSFSIKESEDLYGRFFGKAGKAG